MVWKPFQTGFFVDNSLVKGIPKKSHIYEKMLAYEWGLFVIFFRRYIRHKKVFSSDTFGCQKKMFWQDAKTYDATTSIKVYDATLFFRQFFQTSDTNGNVFHWPTAKQKWFKWKAWSYWFSIAQRSSKWVFNCKFAGFFASQSIQL